MKLTRIPMVWIACGLLIAALIGCRPQTAENGDVATVAIILVAPTQTPDPPTPTPSPAPPTLAPTATPGPPPPPGPTSPPLPAPLTAEQALQAALELDRTIVSRTPIVPDELAAGASVTLHDGRAAADAALGIQAGYAAEVEADAGQVWLITLPGPVWGVSGPGFSPWAVFGGVAYQFSARTGHFLSLYAGPQLPGLNVLFALDDDLYRTDLGGKVIEQLTTGGRLGWGMAANDADWWLEAMLRPPQVSPDGYTIAFAPHSTTIVVAGVQRPLLSTPTEFPGTGVLAWSPDSRWLAYAVDENDIERSQLAVYDLYNQTTTLLLLDEAAPDIRNLAWSPDSSRIAFGCCFAEDFDDEGEYLGTETGELRVARVSTGEIETVGPLQSSIGGGNQVFCWTQDNRIVGLTAEDTTELSAQCSALPDGSTAPDGQRRFFVTGPPQPDATETVYTLVVEDVTAGELWRRDLEPGLWPRAWLPDGAYILLDDDANHSPIWRIRADGTGEPEVLIEDAYFLAVVPAWQ